jgi:hypothetical protein
LDFLKDKSNAIDRRFIQASQYLMERAKSQGSPEKADSSDPSASAPKLNSIDMNLIVALHKVYFPSKPLSKGEGEFSAWRFVWQSLTAPVYPGLRLHLAGKAFKIEELLAMSWPENDAEIEDLLSRYFFARIFGKLYFGAGFGQLSLIAGFHHLAILLALVKLQARALALSRSAPSVSLLDVAAAVRQLEKRVGEATVGRYAAALFELFLYSPRRVRRILDTCR